MISPAPAKKNHQQAEAEELETGEQESSPLRKKVEDMMECFRERHEETKNQPRSEVQQTLARFAAAMPEHEQG